MATLLPQSLAIRLKSLNRRVHKSPGPKDLDRFLSRNGIPNSSDERNLHRLRDNRSRNQNFEANATPGASVDSFRQMFSTSKAEEPAKESAFLFRTEFGGLVNVFVRKKNLDRVVSIEVSSLELPNGGGRLVLNWGLSSGDGRVSEAPLVETSSGRFYAELEFEANLVPCYLSFRLRSLDVDVRTHRETDFRVPLGFGSGRPAPLGLSFPLDGSVNFSIFSRSAESVVLCLYGDDGNPALELDLDPYINRTGDLWHVSFETAQSFSSYGYRFNGASVVLDPYSKIVADFASGNRGTGPKYLGRVEKELEFDWSGDIRPNLPMEKLMVYRLNVRRFTEHKSSRLPLDVAGTFSGLSAKLEHLKYLGVNAVLLEPIFPFDERKGPYFPRHFFSPTNLYGGTASAIDSMKELVKKMHANGMEVLLEVVFTGALEGVDDSSYYLNFPVTQRLVLDSLRRWVSDFRVDGFCFVDASSLLRGPDGEILSRPPLIEAVAFDPLLSKTKIVADWRDPPAGARFPHWRRWAETNPRFRRDIRNFLRGKGKLGSLATRLCGSGDVFSDGRGPAFSLNFIAGNSGLPLVDLVSFSGGSVSSELSWNCGQEGPTNKTVVLERRVKQIRNFIFVLYVSLGIPVLNMGDECGQSTGGSVEYSARKPYDWSALETGFGIQVAQFIAFLSSLRTRRSDSFQKRDFRRDEDVEWFGSDQFPPRWDDPSCKFLAVRLRADEDRVLIETASSKSDLFVAFNTADCSETLVLPQPEEGIVWLRLVDTALPFPGFFSADGEPVTELCEGKLTYQMKSHSCTLFEARLG